MKIDQITQSFCKYFIIHQIPKDLVNYNDKVEMIEQEKEFYGNLGRKQGNMKYVFQNEGLDEGLNNENE